MASIDRRTRDGKVTWVARWRDPAGAQRKRSFVRKTDAERWLTGVEHGILSGSYVDPEAGRTTFAEYAERWRAVQVHRATTRVHVETMLRLHAYPVFGARPLSSIRPSEVQAWVRGLTLQPSAAEVCYRYVSAVFKAAVADRLIASSPCAGVKLPRKTPRQVVPLATEQIEALSRRCRRGTGRSSCSRPAPGSGRVRRSGWRSGTSTSCAGR